MPKRIQRKRTKGWKMPKGAVYVGRPTVFGNPFDVGYGRRQCVSMYRNMLQGRWSKVFPNARMSDGMSAMLRCVRRDIIERLDQLRGKDLACWCKLPKPGELDMCHARVLLELANA